MTKVTLPKDLAELLERELSKTGKPLDVLKAKLSGKWTNPGFLLNRLDEDTLIRALYLGYQVEQTPEENVRDYFGRISALYELHELDYDNGIMDGVLKTLDLLGIKIEGINA